MGLGDPWSRPKVPFPVEVRRGPALRPERSPSRTDGLLVAALFLSLWLHGTLVGVVVLANWLESRRAPEEPAPVMEIVDLAEFPELSRQVKEMATIPGVNAPDATPPRTDGQLVELAKPDRPEVAREDAKYRSEHDRRVEEETRARETALTPEVLADEFRGLGKEAGKGAERFEGDATDGLAKIGSKQGERGDRGEAGATLPREERSIEQVLKTDEFGILARRAPDPERTFDGSPGNPGGSIEEPGVGGELAMAGAPNNDYLPGVRPGDRTALNAKKDFFASFWFRVQRQVEPFWAKHVRASNPGHLQHRDYLTRVNVVLAPDGSLVAVDVEQSCGIPAWDRAVLAAFQDASPFLNPPQGLIEKDGRIHMDDLGFIVSLTGGKVVHMYGDPRSGKLFPGVNEGGIGPR